MKCNTLQLPRQLQISTSVPKEVSSATLMPIVEILLAVTVVNVNMGTRVMDTHVHVSNTCNIASLKNTM